MSRTSYFAIIFALIFSLESIAQTAPPKQEVKLCVVAGRVIKGDSAEPVRKAKVTLHSTTMSDDTDTTDVIAGTPTATTDQDGNFLFENLKPGTYSLRIEKTGFAGVSNARSRSAKAEQRLTLVAGQEIRDMVIRMVASAAVSGRVLDQDGEPMPNVGVRVLRYRYAGQSKRRLRPMNFAETNDLGEYRIFGLAPGEYYMSVVPRRREVMLEATAQPASKDAPAKVQYQYATTYYPGVANEQDAQALPLRAGDEARADFNLVMSPTVKISGRVVGLGASRDGIRGAVQVMSAPGEPVGNAMIKEGTDSFEIAGVLAGTYQLVAVGAPKDENINEMGTTKVTVNSGDLSGVVITLKPNTPNQQSIKGKISIVRGPAENIDHLGVMLRPAKWRDGGDDDANPFQMFGGGGRSGTVNKDGTFTMEAYGNGTVIATVFGSGSGVEDYYTKSIRYAGRDVTETGFSLATNAPLEVEIGADGGRVEGVAVDEKDKPISEATVVLVPEGNLRKLPDMYATEHTDQNGHFLMRGVRPGSYTIYAWDDLGEDEGAYYYEDFLKKFADKAQSIRVEAKQRAAVKVNVQSADPGAQAQR